VEVQLPPVSGSPATSSPLLSPLGSGAVTASRWSVQTASTEDPTAATWM
jgi:hypothetical protein